MGEQPFISVIVPTRRRREQLRECLISLSAQTYPRERWELTVVEDGDEEAPDEGLAAFRDRLRLQYLRQAYAGCGVARNTGAAQARGRYLVFTDDDCLFPSDWLWRYEQHFQRRADCVVAGRPIDVPQANRYSQASQALIDYLLSRFNTSPEQATLAIGNNFGVPAEAFRAVGGFSPRYFRTTAEDRDFCARWVAKGQRIVYAPDIVVHHACRLNLGSFLRQHFHYGRGAFLFHQLQAQRRGGRIKLEPPGFYFSLLLWPWSVRAGPDAARMSLLFVVAQAAHTAGYLHRLLGGSEARCEEPVSRVHTVV